MQIEIFLWVDDAVDAIIFLVKNIMIFLMLLVVNL